LIESSSQGKKNLLKTSVPEAAKPPNEIRRSIRKYL
jgi:hypothetical protein